MADILTLHRAPFKIVPAYYTRTQSRRIIDLDTQSEYTYAFVKTYRTNKRNGTVELPPNLHELGRRLRDLALSTPAPTDGRGSTFSLPIPPGL